MTARPPLAYVLVTVVRQGVVGGGTSARLTGVLESLTLHRLVASPLPANRQLHLNVKYTVQIYEGLGKVLITVRCRGLLCGDNLELHSRRCLQGSR